MYSLAGLRGIIDHFSNVYTYEHVSLITSENFERFPERVKKRMENYPEEKPKSLNAKVEVLSECIKAQILTLNSKNRNVLIKQTCYSNRYGLYQKIIA